MHLSMFTLKLGFHAFGYIYIAVERVWRISLGMGARTKTVLFS